MKILWLCNIVLPELAEEINIPKAVVGGWLTGVWRELKKKKEMEMALCIPIKNPLKLKDGKFENYYYYSFYAQYNIIDRKEQISRFCEILEEFQPDIVDIWGTEYLHTWEMVQACKKLQILEKVLIHIQGLVSVIEKYYAFGISNEVLEKKVNGNSIKKERDNFRYRGNYEVQALEEVNYISGRTEWDKYWSKKINEKINYYFCNEMLREGFYNNLAIWDANDCQKHSIFISQAGYAVKGIHLVLKELWSLKKKYIDLEVYIAGIDINTIQSTYASYVLSEIKQYNLEKTIHFLGKLNEAEMVIYYRKANIFLSTSVIENSSNSICEAMYIGTPVVASCVGGTQTLIQHGTSGFLYPLEETYMMEYYIDFIFQNIDAAVEISKKEREIARKRHNKAEIMERLLSIYKTIMEEPKLI